MFRLPTAKCHNKFDGKPTWAFEVLVISSTVSRTAWQKCSTSPAHGLLRSIVGGRKHVCEAGTRNETKKRLKLL